MKLKTVLSDRGSQPRFILTRISQLVRFQSIIMPSVHGMGEKKNMMYQILTRCFRREPRGRSVRARSNRFVVDQLRSPFTLEFRANFAVRYDPICTNNELWFSCPLMIADEITRLQPYVLLSLRQESVAT